MLVFHIIFRSSLIHNRTIVLVSLSYRNYFCILEHFDTTLMLSQVKKTLEKRPDLEPELTSFLDFDRIKLVDRHSRTPHKPDDFIAELQLGKSDLNPLLVFSRDEVMYVRPPKDANPEAMREYRAFRRATLFPKRIRDLILVNKKLMQLLKDKKTKIDRSGISVRGDSYEFRMRAFGRGT